ncbi:MAG: hypothetical protein HY322_05880 [Betaproteobacteria bacterium]|nr:hypothetical protein [Betaproteobacteria bacterium]
MLSALGEPFNAEIELVSVQKEDLASLSARLASPDAYQQANLQYGSALVGLRISIEKRADGQPFIKVTSSRPVSEPFLDLLIELNWSSGRLLREFTALLDPPGMAPAPVVAEPLAPAPQVRPAPAPASAAALRIPPVAAGSYGPIQRGETLSKIAGSLKPEGVTLEQMLVGLFRSNPEAFINKNMNLVRSGKILRVPERDEIAAVSQREAVKEYRAQVADWKGYRARLADAPAAARDGSPAVSGRITTRIDDGAATGAKDVVRLSKGEAPGPGAVGTGGKGSATDRIRTLEEEVASRDKALKEANERVAQLEKTIKDMQRLAEIKSAGMAAAQQQAQTKAAATPESAKPEAKASAAPQPAAPTATPKPTAAPAPAAEGQAAAKPGTEKAADKPAPKPAADKPKPKPEVKAAPAPSLIDTLLDDPMYLGGGAVVVLGGLGYWLLRRRRRQEAAPEPAAKVAPVLATPEAAATVTPQDAPKAAAAELDPLDEASVYLTHGRDAQAEAILTEAIAKNPGRDVLHVKLLEVYALRKDKAAFAKRAEDFHKLSGGAGDNWIRVAAMGSGLDPANPLYGAAKDASPATPPAAEAAGHDLDFNLDAPPAETASPAPVQASAAPDVELEIPADQPKAAAPAPADTDTLDFEIEVPKLDVPPAAPATPAPAAADSAAALDFKLDLGALDLGLDDRKPGAVPADEHDAHWHDVQAKFDLAKAYQEMGDRAGAGEILKEVMQEGDAEQQAKAKTLLDGLG